MYIYYYISPNTGDVFFEYGESQESELIQDFINHEDIESPKFIQSLANAETYTSNNALNDLSNHFWRELSNIPTSSEGDDKIIDQDFFHFPKGTAVDYIWRWIEKELNVFRLNFGVIVTG